MGTNFFRFWNLRITWIPLVLDLFLDDALSVGVEAAAVHAVSLRQQDVQDVRRSRTVIRSYTSRMSGRGKRQKQTLGKLTHEYVSDVSRLQVVSHGVVVQHTQKPLRHDGRVIHHLPVIRRHFSLLICES